MPPTPRIHYIQHVAFESLGCMRNHLLDKGCTLTSTRLFEGQTLPDIDSLDWLIIMGGPMGVYEQDKYPWLTQELHFIRDCMDAGKTVLGICLGAQLMATALGGEVRKNHCREIGWHPVVLNPDFSHPQAAGLFPARFTALHWHGDTFSIPENCTAIGSSAACANQGFIHGDTAWALQFHLEMTHSSVSGLIERCGHELDGSLHVQNAEEILANRKGFENNNRLMFDILDRLFELTTARLSSAP